MDFREVGAAMDAAWQGARAQSGQSDAERQADPEMLLPSEMADRLGISVLELAHLKTEKKILALGVTLNDSLRYPSWQLGADGRLLPGLDRVISEFNYHQAWQAARFLLARDRHYLKMLAEGKAREVVAELRDWNQRMVL
jgi:hypothetical protein